MNREIKFRAWDMRRKRKYTGLKDKNGKEICEGDRVVADNSLGNSFIVDMQKLDVLQHLKYFAKDYEIIGNIYENLELL